jgi:hypothetical protein
MLAGTERQPRSAPGVVDRSNQRRQHQGSFGHRTLADPRVLAGHQRRRDREQGLLHDRVPHHLRPGAFGQEHLGNGIGAPQ